MGSGNVRWWFLFGLSVFVIVVGMIMGIMFMRHVDLVFDRAVATAGSDPATVVKHLAQACGGVLAWIVFGITMTNALIITSSLSVVMMLGGAKDAKA